MKGSQRALVTIGTFDGIHRGHQKLLRWVRDLAREMRMSARVVFFERPPRFHLRPYLECALLTDAQERRRILKRIGIDHSTCLRFDKRLARMSPAVFFEDYILRRWRAGGLLVGRDFAFGRGRRGDLRFLHEACRKNGIRLGVLPLVRIGGRKISSSDIRRQLAKGRVDEAARLLGRYYSVVGRVERGQGLGRILGFATANLRLPQGLLLPPGVFEVRVEGIGLRRRRGVCNVGVRPTVDHRQLIIKRMEVHILGWDKNLYGRRLRVHFIRRLRGERRFPDLQALQTAVRRDIARVGRFSGRGGRVPS